MKHVVRSVKCLLRQKYNKIIKKVVKVFICNDESIKKSIGAKIKAARVNRGLTQSALAEKVDMDEKQLSRLESGKHYPTLKTLLAIANILEMRLADFDDIEELKTKEYYTLVEILKASSAEELKKFLKVIKAIRG